MSKQSEGVLSKPSTNETVRIPKELVHYENENRSDSHLHQFVAVKFMTKLQKYGRGLLVFHGTGTGKTRLSVLVARHYSRTDPSRKIIILAPKSLHTNTKKTIDRLDADNADKYQFISLNSSNMFEKVSAMDSRSSFLSNLSSFIKIERSLENTLLIIDEYHNLSNAIVNGSKNALQLFNMVMKTQNIKLLFLTGTPIVNRPYELVPTINMLSGMHTTLPEYESDFVKYFIDTENNLIKNEQLFLRRIYGLVSFYKKNEESSIKKDFPIQLELQIIKATMSNFQFLQYKHLREKELQEESKFQVKKSQPQSAAPFQKNIKLSNSYRIKSRQACNFTSEDANVQVNSNNIEMYSSKYFLFLKHLNKKTKGIKLLYSEFITNGLDKVAELLTNEGWSHFLHSKEKSTTRSFAIISGRVPLDEQTEIVTTVNSSSNVQGEVIELLMISKTGAEGLNLKNIREIHIMEPFWNYARIEQVIARGVRFQSHNDLPESERTVQPYLYLSILPDLDQSLTFSERKSTDESLYESSFRGKRLIKAFEEVLVRGSIDCTVHNLSNDCFECVPNGFDLYTDDIQNDLIYSSCMKPKKHKLEVREIIVTDKGTQKTFYYIHDGDFNFRIFFKDHKLDSYILLPLEDPMHSTITKHLLENFSI